MRKLLCFALMLGTFGGMSCGNVSAQTRNGIPPFGSAAGGPDTINLANLNVDISVPIRSKAGRGTNFTYGLNYDSLIWSPVNSSGIVSWQPPSSDWGWSGLEPAGSSYVLYSVVFTSGHCGYQGQSSYQEWIYSNFAYYDNFGVWHQFPNIGGDYYNSPGGTTCPPNGPQPTTQMSELASDGSGYTLYATMAQNPIAHVVDKNGSTFNVPTSATVPTTGVTSTIDRNGNIISQSNGVYTDTLGTTALTLVSSLPTSTTLSYATPSGATPGYVVSYLGHIVRTAFGCSNVTEYNSGTTQIYLVDKITLPDGSFYHFTYEPTPGFSGDVTGRLASVTYPTGGQISYTYTGGSSGHITCSNGNPAGITRQTPDGTWSYSYVAGSGSASTTTTTDPTSSANQTVVQFQGMYETERKVYQGPSTGTLLQTVDTCYNSSASPCTTTAVNLPIAQTSRIVTLPGVSNLMSKVVNLYNGSGLPTEIDAYDYGPGAPPSSPLRKTVIAYAALGNGILSMPATVTVEDGSGVTKAQTTYTYDQGSVTATSGTPQHGAVTGSRGNATTISQLIQGTSTLSKTFTYYDTGTVNTTTDVNGTVTTLNYANSTSTCGNAFATSVNEPLSLSRSVTWNCSGAVQTQLTDENSQISSTTYTDPYFWRPASFTDPAGAVTSYSYATSSPFNWTDSKLTFNSGNSVVDSLLTVDSLGRVHLKQKRQGPASNNYDTVETDYDSVGRVARVTVPFSGTIGQTNSTAPATTTTYDPLSRPLIVTDGGSGTSTSTYSQNDVLVAIGPAPSGENTKSRQLEYNGMGQLTSVCELTSATGSGTCGQRNAQTGFWTTYTFDVMNDLTGVTQNAQAPAAQQQTRNYVYDGTSRLTSETNPEPGTTSYGYDSASGCTGTFTGDLVKRVDAVGNTTCFAYDILHRKTSATYSGPYSGVTPNKYFVYDAATVNSVAMVKAKTRLAEAYTATTQAGTKITDLGFSYSTRGETSDTYESTPHSSGYYHLTETYWASGLPFQLSGLPGLPAISYGGTIGSTVGLDGEGRITQVTASSGQNPLSGASYNVFGMPTSINYGSSDSDVFSYDANTARMTQYQFNVNTQSDMGTLTWNPNGTLKSLLIADAFNTADTQSCSYSFDDLKRVAGVNCGSATWTQTFGFDAFGNITKTGTVGFQPVYKNPTTGYTSNRFVSIPGVTVSYDLNGNVSNDGSHTYSWDAENRPVTIDGVNMTYDALGRMVEQNRSGVVTELVYGPTTEKLAFMSGQTLQKARVKLPGNASALYTSAGLSYYRHPDWLGSIRLGSNTARAMYSDVAYAPFGEAYAQAGATDYSFAGMDQDSVSGDYDGAEREYSTQGRWPSPDPSGSTSARLAFPQSWNRYAYALNNPLSLLDPTGLDCVYLNDGGSAAESIDTSSSAGECGSNGGYWIPGTVNPSSITVNVNSGWISASSNFGSFAAGCNGAGCGPGGTPGTNPFGGVPIDPATDPAIGAYGIVNNPAYYIIQDQLNALADWTNEKWQQSCPWLQWGVGGAVAVGGAMVPEASPGVVWGGVALGAAIGLPSNCP
jgi:RHS repeat-associated protein